MNRLWIGVLTFFYIIQLTPQQQSAEPRNSAGAEALAVARRPKEASREKTRPPPVSRGSSPWKDFDRRKVVRASIAKKSSERPSASSIPPKGVRNGCISMQRYWSSLRFSFLRTLFLLAADYVVIQRLQHSPSPRPRSHGLRQSQPPARDMSEGRKHSSKRSGPPGGRPPRSTVQNVPSSIVTAKEIPSFLLRFCAGAWKGGVEESTRGPAEIARDSIRQDQRDAGAYCLLPYDFCIYIHIDICIYIYVYLFICSFIHSFVSI